MRLTQNQLINLVYNTMAEMNYKLKTSFTRNKMAITFFTPDNGIEVYESLCSRYFPNQLLEKYKEEGYFINFAAMAFVGEEKDGILIREDLDFSLEYWHHIFLHELAHIFITREELNGKNFYHKYCVNYAQNTLEDGCINAGYAIWREFVAELFASLLDETIEPYTLDDIRTEINKLLPFVIIDDNNAKISLQRMLNLLFNSDDYHFAKNADDFIARIQNSSVSQTLVFEDVVRHIYSQLSKKNVCKINLSFIRDLGSFYIKNIMDNTVSIRKQVTVWNLIHQI